METKETFAKLKSHILEGMVFHDEMSRYFDFLGMDGQKKCHEHHYEEETKNYRTLCSFYMKHYNQLIPTEPMSQPDVIPQNWFNYERKDVDISTKRNAVKTAYNKWIAWESETKSFYEDMYAELMDNAEISSALFIEYFISDVSEELAEAKVRQLKLESVGYELTYINE